jgi:hypothetical protein
MGRSDKPARLAAAAALVLAAAAASAPLAVSSASAQGRQCFRAQDWRGSSAGGPRDIYIRVGMKDIWRLAMADDCPGARFPGPVSIGNLVTGSNEICSAVDLQITVAPLGSSNHSACIVKSISKLTPEEAKALPRKVVP